MEQEIIEYISKAIDDLDKISMYLQSLDEKTREQDIAIQKLQEAVFWLTFGIEEK